MAAKPTSVLIGCKEYFAKLLLPPGCTLVKQGRITDRGADYGKPQYVYRHAETGTWYQVTEHTRSGDRVRRFNLCEYVGSDCPCAKGKM